MVKTGLTGDQFSSDWCHFSTTVTLFYQVIDHNDKKVIQFHFDHICVSPSNYLGHGFLSKESFSYV